MYDKCTIRTGGNMSTFADETAADMPVKDITLTLSHFAPGPQGTHNNMFLWHWNMDVIE